jgi:hypothetical protein
LLSTLVVVVVVLVVALVVLMVMVSGTNSIMSCSCAVIWEVSQQGAY